MNAKKDYRKIQLAKRIAGRAVRDLVDKLLNSETNEINEMFVREERIEAMKRQIVELENNNRADMNDILRGRI